MYSEEDFTMPRMPRQVSPTGVYHFINRGVNKKRIFHRDKDFNHYLELLQEYSRKFEIHIYHYCIMTNHSHLLLKAKDISLLSQFGHFIQRRYAYYYCKTHHWSEQVFRKRFVSLVIDKDSYLLECGRYIERNPLRAGIVKDLKSYPYTSYSYYAYQEPNDLLIPNPFYLDIAKTKEQRAIVYQEYLSQDRPYEQMVDAVFFKANVSPWDGVR